MKTKKRNSSGRNSMFALLSKCNIMEAKHAGIAACLLAAVVEVAAAICLYVSGKFQL